MKISVSFVLIASAVALMAGTPVGASMSGELANGAHTATVPHGFTDGSRVYDSEHVGSAKVNEGTPSPEEISGYLLHAFPPAGVAYSTPRSEGLREAAEAVSRGSSDGTSEKMAGLLNRLAELWGTPEFQTFEANDASRRTIAAYLEQNPLVKLMYQGGAHNFQLHLLGHHVQALAAENQSMKRALYRQGNFFEAFYSRLSPEDRQAVQNYAQEKENRDRQDFQAKQEQEQGRATERGAHVNNPASAPKDSPRYSSDYSSQDRQSSPARESEVRNKETFTPARPEAAQPFGADDVSARGERTSERAGPAEFDDLDDESDDYFDEDEVDEGPSEGYHEPQLRSSTTHDAPSSSSIPVHGAKYRGAGYDRAVPPMVTTSATPAVSVAA